MCVWCSWLACVRTILYVRCACNACVLCLCCVPRAVCCVRCVMCVVLCVGVGVCVRVCACVCWRASESEHEWVNARRPHQTFSQGHAAVRFANNQQSERCYLWVGVCLCVCLCLCVCVCVCAWERERERSAGVCMTAGAGCPGHFSPPFGQV